MKTTKAIITGFAIWVIGVTVYTLSFYLPFLEDQEFQANLSLALALIPLAWFGAGFYFRNQSKANAALPALLMVAVAIALDALITVPVLIIPVGGSYSQFFGAISFWMLTIEYLAIVILYWWIRVKPLNIKI